MHYWETTFVTRITGKSHIDSLEYALNSRVPNIQFRNSKHLLVQLAPIVYLRKGYNFDCTLYHTKKDLEKAIKKQLYDNGFKDKASFEDRELPKTPNISL